MDRVGYLGRGWHFQISRSNYCRRHKFQLVLACAIIVYAPRRLQISTNLLAPIPLALSASYPHLPPSSSRHQGTATLAVDVASCSAFPAFLSAAVLAVAPSASGATSVSTPPSAPPSVCSAAVMLFDSM